nr:MAG: glycoprotein precursor [Fushun diaea subdola nairovirus 1]
MHKRKSSRMLVILLLCLVYTTSAQHDAPANFDHFPEWFKDSKQEGFYIMGWEGNHTYSVFAFGLVSVSPECTVASETSFSHSLTFVGKGLDKHCTLKFRNNGKLYETILDETALPHPSCRDPSEVFAAVSPNTHSPGSRIVYCTNSSMFEHWNELQDSKGCYNTYFHLHYRSCSFIYTTHRKLLASCDVEIKKSQLHPGNNVEITTHSEGTVQLKSERFIKTEACNFECNFEIGVVNELTVTCPDGSQHHFAINKDLRDKCMGVDIPYLRWVAIVICKITFHPWLIITMLIWYITSEVIFQYFCYLMSSSFHFLHKKISLRLQRMDEETGHCKYCGGILLNEEAARQHSRCHLGECRFCGASIKLSALHKHAIRCQAGAEALKELISSVDKLSKFFRASRFLLVVASNKLVNRIIKWAGLATIFLLIFIPPIGANAVTNTGASQTHPETIRYHSIDDNIESPLTNVSKFTEQCAEEGLEAALDGFQPSYFDQLAEELDFCSRRCFTNEGYCACPSADPKFSKFMDNGSNLFDGHLQNPNDMLDVIDSLAVQESLHERDRRNAPEDRIAKDHRRARTRNMQKASTARSLNPANHKKSITRSNKRLRKYFEVPMKTQEAGRQFAHLAYAKNILTNWGNIHVESSFTPSENDRNIAVSWETIRQDKDKVYIKGTSSVYLEVAAGSGINFELSHPDSDEKGLVSTYIYDYSQVYSTTLKYVTSDRIVDQWFRGACTGSCVSKCACTTNTCHYKQWDQDRGWGCNPSWCWSSGTGCSCCAVDVNLIGGKWIAAVYEVQYEGTELLICQSIGYDKFNCRVVSDNDVETVEDFKFSYGKISSIDYKLPPRIAVFWEAEKETKFKPAFPSGVWLNPDICDFNCNHGVPGDVKSKNLKIMSESPNMNDDSYSMSWTGLEIEHICHFADWPDCEFYNLEKDITYKFDHINKTSEHLNVRFTPQRLTVSKDSGLDLRVKPKGKAGIIPLTLQVKNFALTKKHIKPEFSSFRIIHCEGCYACAAGFTCSFIIRIKTPDSYNVHVKPHSSFVTTSDQTYTVSTKESKKTFELRGFTMLNMSEITFCIEEQESLCSKSSITLHEPDNLLIEKNNLVSHQKNTDTQCKGVGGFFGCTFSNMRSSLAYIGNSVLSAFTGWFGFLKAMIYLVLIMLFGYVSFKVGHLTYMVFRGITPKKKFIDPKKMIEENHPKGH